MGKSLQVQHGKARVGEKLEEEKSTVNILNQEVVRDGYLRLDGDTSHRQGTGQSVRLLPARANIS
jgi:hypothetical protein